MWNIQLTDTCRDWFLSLDDTEQEDVLFVINLLEQAGPRLSRPYADTINGSKHRNMKELRIQSRGRPIRAFFAFDPERNGVVLCAGYKDSDEKRFYKTMIAKADAEYDHYLSGQK